MILAPHNFRRLNKEGLNLNLQEPKSGGRKKGERERYCSSGE